MSGHNKWSKVKRIKAVKDVQRASVFTKLGNLITVAAREKGGDPETNFSLRLAMEKAKQANMPKDNIEKAIKRGTGELVGDQIEELYYEGMGPANFQFIVKSLTDNKNRSASNVRHIFTKYGGSLATVNWNFDKKGVINITKEEMEEKGLSKEDKQLELIDAGAEDFEFAEEGLTVYSQAENLQKVQEYLESGGVKIESADIEYIPKEDKEPTPEEKEKLDKFIEELENCEDVSDYYTNASL